MTPKDHISRWLDHPPIPCTGSFTPKPKLTFRPNRVVLSIPMIALMFAYVLDTICIKEPRKNQVVI